jgi:hypothetical protein
MKMLLSLPFTKPECVLCKFIELKQIILLECNSDAMLKFLNYFDRTYVGTATLPIFKVTEWSVYQRILQDIPTTSNFAEAWNRSLNYSVRNPHPALNDIIKELRTRDFLTTIEIRNHLTIRTPKKLSEKLFRLKNAVLDHDNFYGLTFLFVISEIKKDIYK